METERTLVLGIGNTLLSDEGVGIHVINYLTAAYPDTTGVSFVDGGTLSFTLAHLLVENQRVIVVDAARTGGAPGTLVVLEAEEMDRYLMGNRSSVHEVGLMDLLDIARLSDHYPSHRALIGIEPESLEWGEQPSAVVAVVVPKAAEQVMALVHKWDGGENS